VRSTLFYIPAQWLGVPVFGFGWLLLAWAIFCGVTTVSLLRTPGGRRELGGNLPFFVLIAALIVFVLPSLVERDSDGRVLGVPVHAWGVMMIPAVIGGVALTAYRAWQVGISPEKIYSLAFVMVIAGLLGARLFYVVQYWTQFVERSAAGGIDVRATVVGMLNVTKGGMVVYGSVLAGVPAGIWFCRKRGLPILAVGDVIAASMVLGLAIGRIGCFLNGCCFGGVCLTESYSVTFPAGSPPYLQHEERGWDSGVWLERNEGRIVVSYVAPQSATASVGLRVGDNVVSINGAKIESLAEARERLARGSRAWEVETSDGRILRWQSDKPARSVPVHPTQVYAAIDGALLALVLWFYFPYRRHEGEVFAVLLVLQPVSRFFLEMIRSDEPGQFGTALTISQWISLALIAAGIVLFVYLEWRPRRPMLTTAAT